MMPTITSIKSPASPTVSAPVPNHGVSELIDPSETLYRLNIEEYERIGEFLDNPRVELIDGYLVAKMTRKPPHVIACERVRDAIVKNIANGWHTRAGDPVRIPGYSEPEPDVALVRGALEDYAISHPGPADIALIIEVADTTLAKDRRRTLVYGPGGIPVYWIINLVERQVEVYAGPGTDGYNSRTIYVGAELIPLVVDGVRIGQIAVSEILP